MTQNNKGKSDRKKFLVVGLGAIGSIFAAHMKHSGCTVYGIDVRQDFIDAIHRDGIVIEGFTSCKAKLDQVCTHPDQLEEKDFDYVVVAVKTPYLEEVVGMIETFNNDFKVVSAQNGIDNEEYLARYFGRERSIRLVLNFAGNIMKPGDVKMTFFHAPNYLGCLCGNIDCPYVKDLADLMTRASLDSEAVPDIKKYSWRKSILVSSLSPVAAMMGMTMAEVMADGDTRSIVVKILREAIEVAGVLGFDFGDGFFNHCLDYLSTAGHHKPSMLVDIELGSPTEIDYLNGKIIYHGNLLNVQVPLNTSLHSMIKAKERMQLAAKKELECANRG
jgi:2-dehydropantoate 2-reductase